jgi:PKD repeat protein
MTADCHPVWSWNFGDGAGTSPLENPTYSYAHNQESMLETVKLVASTYDGFTTRTTTFTLTIQL